MTELLINYKWNEIFLNESKIISLKRENYGDISFMIRITKDNRENTYDYISLKSLPNDVKMSFIYDEDKIRIRFAHNADLQEFIKENKYFLEDLKIYEVMTEPLFKKENE